MRRGASETARHVSTQQPRACEASIASPVGELKLALVPTPSANAAVPFPASVVTAHAAVGTASPHCDAPGPLTLPLVHGKQDVAPGPCAEKLAAHGVHQPADDVPSVE